MYVSIREKELLNLVLEYPEGITVERIQNTLNISRRTVYREISNIEKTLKSVNLKIKNIRGAGYVIYGSNDNILQLKKILKNKVFKIFKSNIERQNAILVILLLSNTEYTIESLSIDCSVGVTTIKNDLKSIEDNIISKGIVIKKSSGRGIKILANENFKRMLLSNIISESVSEYEFFGLLNNISIEDNFFLQIVPSKYIVYANKLFEEAYSSKITDNQFKYILITLSITIWRMEQDNYIELNDLSDVTPRSTQIASQILIKVAQKLNIEIPIEELNFLSKQIEGINYKNKYNILDDSFDIGVSYKVSKLIEDVSVESKIRFQEDSRLYEDLLAHIISAIKRPNIGSFDNKSNLLKTITIRYKSLSDIIWKNIDYLFNEYNFSDIEKLYIIIHFATSFERNPSNVPISILVICSNSIGTASILESRLKKFFPEVVSIKILKLSEIDKIEHNDYTIMLSTIVLPHINNKYKIVSPLLTYTEVKEIKNIISSMDLKNISNNIKENTDFSGKKFETLYKKMQIANNILNDFSINDLENSNYLEDTIQELLLSIDRNIITDINIVFNKIMTRYNISPIGIPSSNIALFHCSSIAVLKPFFSIYNLTNSFSIVSMDGELIEMNRILFLVSPEITSKETERILGKISSSIIESTLNLDIYMYGDKNKVKSLLDSLFVNEIKGS